MPGPMTIDLRCFGLLGLAAGLVATRASAQEPRPNRPGRIVPAKGYEALSFLALSFMALPGADGAAANPGIDRRDDQRDRHRLLPDAGGEAETRRARG